MVNPMTQPFNGTTVTLALSIQRRLVRALLLSVLFCAPFSQALSLSPQMAIEQLGYQELAATFSRDKALARSGRDSADLRELQALAVLALIGAPSDPQALADFIAHYKTPGPAYLGDLGETSLYTRLESRWQQLQPGQPSAFALALHQLIDQNIATGYNLATSPWPHFAPQRHIIYGHSDLTHARQLLVLLASEGMRARVALSSKSSAFVYRDEWGTAANMPLLVLPSGKRLVIASEYDLHFEFAHSDDKTQFMALVDRYAKKERTEQPGLLRSSWWQPFFRSPSAHPGYQAITQVVVQQGDEKARLMSLPSQAPALVTAIAALKMPWQIDPQPQWVNPAFYRYLEGGAK